MLLIWHMLPIPWRQIESWNCLACGSCCKGYEVVLDFPEWINIVKDYGVNYTQSGISKLFLKHKADGTCIFLYNDYGGPLCSLQHMKPMACKLWPFKISDRPKYGKPNEAAYRIGERSLFVYVEPSCVGIRFGNPSREFVSATLPEFVGLALGRCKRQFFSTSKLFQLQQWKLV